MNQHINIYRTPEELAEKFAEILYEKIITIINKQKQVNIVLSGGSTPKLLYSVLAKKYAAKIEWEKIEFYWGDERCVPPGHSESNFAMTKSVLLDFISIPEENIHRIKGENNPNLEAERYSEEIRTFIIQKNCLPSFDIVLLGIGEDGHTASIFPDQMHLLNSDKICDVALHPSTQQKRITITGRILNNSDNIFFLATGKSKSEILKKIINNLDGSDIFPATHICSFNGETKWFLDESAAALLTK